MSILSQMFLGLSYFGAVTLNNFPVMLVGAVGILGATFSGLFTGARIEHQNTHLTYERRQGSIGRQGWIANSNLELGGSKLSSRDPLIEGMMTIKEPEAVSLSESI